MVKLILAGIWGYLLGSVPTGVLVCRAVRGVDVRMQGSGHTGGLNAARVTGFWGGALTAVGDALLGMAAVAGAVLAVEDPWAATVAGALAIVGHDWSVFIRFGGGIGLSTLLGALLWLDPLRTLGTLVAEVLLWFALAKLLRLHRARSTILAMCAIGPLLWALGSPPNATLLSVLGGAAVIVKTVSDWNREYE